MRAARGKDQHPGAAGTVRGALAARYPEDQAVGYLTGDLRGAVSVRLVLGG